MPCREDGKVVYAQVANRLCDDSGSPIGVANNKSVLDTQAYEDMKHDGHWDKCFH
jgi:hypothetical protein